MNALNLMFEFNVQAHHSYSAKMSSGKPYNVYGEGLEGAREGF